MEAQRTHLFCTRLDRRAIVSVQNAVTLPPDSVPQPDLALLLPRSDFYRSAAAYSPDTLLLVEVADTTLRYDRIKKLPVCAKAGVREVWIVDLNGAAVEVYTDPDEDGFAHRRVVRGEERLAPSAFPDVEVSAAEILGIPPAS